MKKRTMNGYVKLMKATPLIIGSCLMGLSGSLHALGLGNITLKSHLNEPLNAEVEILSAQTLSKHEIIATLAKPAAFEKAGVEYNFFLNQLKFKPVFKKNGKVVLSIKTKDSVKEPFLDFLVEIHWPSGRLQREYTLLLDPPVYSEEPVSSTISAPLVEKAKTQYKTSTATPTIIDNGNFSRYSVKSGDTLWAVARKVPNASGNSMQQRMVAIYAANPQAFIKNNINNLKRGATLKIPDSETIGSINQNQALLEIAAQNQQFSGRGAGSRPSSVVDTAEYRSGNSTNRPTEDRLKLASPDTSSTDAATVAALESEAVTTLSEENKSLKQKIAQQAEKMAKMERLLELQDSGLASINQDEANNKEINQQQTDETTLDSSADQAAEDATNEDIETPTEDQIVEQETVVDDEQPTETNQQPENSLDNTTAQLNDNVVVETNPVEPPKQTVMDKKTTPVSSVSIEKGFMDKILAMGYTTLAAIASGVIFLFLIVFFWMRRKGMSDESYQSSLDVPLGDGLTEENLPKIADDIFADELGEEEQDYIPESEVDDVDDIESEVENNDDDVADPLGEADVYIAYGKFEQAVKILTEAIEQDEERTDLRLKLLECYGETQSLSDFKAQKEALLAISSDSIVEEQVKQLEQKTWPDEEADVGEIPSTEDIFGDLSFEGDDDDEDELVFPEDEKKNETTDDELEDALEIEKSSGVDDIESEINEAEEVFDLDFSMDDDDLGQIEENDMAIDESELYDSDSKPQQNEEFISLDDLDNEPEPAPEQEEETLELGDVDEASTKLDLARAYIDMEDFDGANEILQEVLIEGNEQQIADANELISQLN